MQLRTSETYFSCLEWTACMRERLRQAGKGVLTSGSDQANKTILVETYVFSSCQN